MHDGLDVNGVPSRLDRGWMVWVAIVILLLQSRDYTDFLAFARKCLAPFVGTFSTNHLVKKFKSYKVLG